MPPSSLSYENVTVNIVTVVPPTVRCQATHLPHPPPPTVPSVPLLRSKVSHISSEVPQTIVGHLAHRL